MDVSRIGSVFSEATRRRVQSWLVRAGTDLHADTYLGWAVISFFVIFLLLLPVSLPAALLVSLLVFSVSLYLPQWLAVLRASRAERELPFFLKSLSTLLRSGIEPYTSLRLAGMGLSTLSSSVERVMAATEGGMSLRRALKAEAATYTSEKVRRSLELVADVIEGGHGLSSLDKYADSLLSAKRIEIREFVNKLSVFTLMFIAVTALVPSMLFIYTALLPLVFGEPVDPALIQFVLFFVIPILTVLFLTYSGSRWIA